MATTKYRTRAEKEARSAELRLLAKEAKKLIRTLARRSDYMGVPSAHDSDVQELYGLTDRIRRVYFADVPIEAQERAGYDA